MSWRASGGIDWRIATIAVAHQHYEMAKSEPGLETEWVVT